MTALLVITENQPLLLMASRAVVSDGRLTEWLRDRGIEKFMAHEVPLDHLREEYGLAFETIEADLKRSEGMRVLDSKGSHVFARIDFADLGRCVRSDLPEFASAPDSRRGSRAPQTGEGRFPEDRVSEGLGNEFG
jgi:hypothetical protein